MWGYFCLLSFLLIVLVEAIFFMVVTGTFENQARDRISSIGGKIVNEVTQNGITESVYRYRSEGVNVYFLSLDGAEIIAPDEPATDDTANVLQEVQRRLEIADAGTPVIFRLGDRMNYLRKIDGVAAADQNCGYVLATYSLAILRQTVGTMQIYLILVGVSMLVLSFAVSYLFSNKLTRGLKTMSDTAVHLAKGDYSVEFTNLDYQEMAQLSDTLNYVRDEVKKSEDFRREILANVTHDLKTPLTMIKAYASMIKEISGDNPEKREKHLQVIIDEADRLTGLVNDVLSVSKLSSNIEEMKPKVFNLTELVYGIINKFGYLQEAQGYNLMVDIDANLYTRADAEKISQVIYNLLGNAANYTGDDKTVYISLKSSMDGKRIKFSVRDTGKGIPKDELPEIWDRYYRVKENHQRPVKGTGLGLNIVKEILQNHGFDFGAESEVGKGSLFWVDFPAVPAEIDISLSEEI